MKWHHHLARFMNSDQWLSAREKSRKFFKMSESPKAFVAIGALGVALLIGTNITTAVFKDGPASASYSYTNTQEASLGNDEASATDTAKASGKEELNEASVANTPSAPAPERFRLKRGETLIDLLKRAKVERRNAHAAVNSLSGVADLRKLRTDQSIQLMRQHDTPEHIQELIIRSDFAHEAVVNWTDGQFRANHREIATIPVTRHIDGEITDSLYLSAKREGVPEKTIIELIRLMSFDVDFQRDIRKGDQFEIYFERQYAPDYDDVDEGTILRARLTLRGQPIDTTFFKTDDGDEGYFDAEGKSTQKALMKTPVEGARLSSRFGRRKHPILGYTRLHKGLDFAAPRGTPIMAAGNGVIEMATRNGSFGNYIRIRHGNSYKTAYAHLKSYGRGIKKGAKVKQGQIIGYIGTTGRSTGPHLHYEVLRDGKQVNPQTLKLPTARTLKAAELESYQIKRARYIAEIEQITATRFAEQTFNSNDSIASR